jgi:hypothetical protein
MALISRVTKRNSFHWVLEWVYKHQQQSRTTQKFHNLIAKKNLHIKSLLQSKVSLQEHLMELITGWIKDLLTSLVQEKIHMWIKVEATMVLQLININQITTWDNLNLSKQLPLNASHLKKIHLQDRSYQLSLLILSLVDRNLQGPIQAFSLNNKLQTFNSKY